MFLRRLIQLASVSFCLVAPVLGEENVWPFFVTRSAATGEASWAQYAGPLFFHQENGPTEVRGFRPLFLTTRTGEAVERNILFPFFTWRHQPGHNSFNFFLLVDQKSDDRTAETKNEQFNVWPLYFSRKSADPEKSYQAFFPLGGTVKNKLGRDRITFWVFPFYVQTQKGDRRATHTLWPIVRSYAGPGYGGFELWPLFGRNYHVGDYDHQFYLWPIVTKSVDHLSAPVPDEHLGVLPFYARASGPGYKSETFVWPFFGYTHRTKPDIYNERRYLWPFLVQGHGSERRVNRWAPVYTHSVHGTHEKTWFLWPLYRHQDWRENGLRQDKDQLLYFLYWSLEQHSLTNPSAAPARKVHLWPLFSSWDNGAGRKQVQALSPFEVFFQRNTKIRQLWTPLFSLYQYDRQPDSTVRHAFLWNAITWRQSPDSKEFHLGPLYESRRGNATDRVAFGCGLFGWQREAGGHWRPFLFDFRMKAANKAGSAASP